MYNWKESFEWGTQQEHEVLRCLADKMPHWNVHPLGGLDEPDGMFKYGGIEIKSYSVWYYKPPIETGIVNGKDSCWMTDERVKLLVVNHAGWLHLYRADKLRQQADKIPQYQANVSQGNGDYKRMNFLYVAQLSDSCAFECDEMDDPKRWNLSQLDDSPYIASIRKS
jgi:hypothetical protein